MRRNLINKFISVSKQDLIDARTILRFQIDAKIEHLESYLEIMVVRMEERQRSQFELLEERINAQAKRLEEKLDRLIALLEEK